MDGELYTRFNSESDLDPKHRKWIGNDDTDRNHHGLVPIDEQPCDMALCWKNSKAGVAKLIGFYRLNLENLCGAGYVARKPGNQVRLRFYHDSDDCIYIEIKPGHPRLVIGKFS
jgi:hypothetical protein